MSYHVRPRAVARAAQLLRQLAGRRRTAQRADPIPGLDALDTYLIATHSELTTREQAAALETTRGNVDAWRKRLYARDLLDRNLRASHAPITDAEARAVARLWHEGWSRAAIAEARGVCESRVSRALLRAGVTGATPRRPALLTVDVCRIFGVGGENLRFWLRAGWLPDNRQLRRVGSRHSWDYDDLIAFVRNRETWVAWTVAQIGDPQLRALAEHARRAAGGAWHQLGEVAAVLGVAFSNLSSWRTQHGVFSGLPVRQWAGARYVWLMDGDLAQLEAWGADVRAHRPGSDKHRWAAHALRQKLIAAYGRPQAVAAD